MPASNLPNGTWSQNSSGPSLLSDSFENKLRAGLISNGFVDKACSDKQVAGSLTALMSVATVKKMEALRDFWKDLLRDELEAFRVGSEAAELAIMTPSAEISMPSVTGVSGGENKGLQKSSSPTVTITSSATESDATPKKPSRSRGGS
ncbi:hypothetical protein JHW43_008179 [Diplocarpon mali]|nr:hypothetical protein JHW43_008179 [Diplocarpon mali]